MTTRSAPPDTYAISVPSGEGRGSTTGPAVRIRRGGLPSVRTTRSSPSSAKAASRTCASVAYDTTPDEVSPARSRRISSSGGTRSPAVSPRQAPSGSASSRSAPSSYSQSRLTGSVPEVDRRKSTRAPSGETVKPRGTPSENRWVRPNCSGNPSVFCVVSSAVASFVGFMATP
ncbi:hypothetical protein GCM10009647_059150 [Streptomyces sanglieri]|uniref:hypothetical protein n=1 Tax=Streptomyces sp. Wh19 TaxID=3076629 RepID=UPI00337BA309